MTTNPGMTSNDPESLRAEIEETRANLSQNVNALGEAVAPSSIARRQVDKAKGVAVGVKDKVMGSAEGAASTMGERASHAGTAVGGSVSNTGQTARAQTQGNPLAAGVIALGAGWLLGSLLPATTRERQAAAQLKEQAAPLASQAQETAKGMASEVAQSLKEPAQQAAESVKGTAQEAVETVKSEGQSAAEDVKESAQQSKDTVQEHRDAPGSSV
jgi:gas vesicle protein